MSDLDRSTPLTSADAGGDEGSQVDRRHTGPPPPADNQREATERTGLTGDLDELADPVRAQRGLLIAAEVGLAFARLIGTSALIGHADVRHTIRTYTSSMAAPATHNAAAIALADAMLESPRVALESHPWFADLAQWAMAQVGLNDLQR